MANTHEEKPETVHIESVPGGEHAAVHHHSKHKHAHVEPIAHAEVVKLGWRSWVVIFITSFAIAAQVFVTGSVTPNIIFITRDIGTPELVGWVIQAPLLMQAILSPVVGRLSDVVDRKWMVTVPPIFAFIGAIISAKAADMRTLIGGGILIGITLPTAAIVHAIQAEVMPMKYRALASGCALVGATIGGFMGSLGGGALVDLGPGGWRYAFWVQAAFHGSTALMFGLFYWPVRRSDYPKMSFRQMFWMFDPIGSFLFLGGSTVLLLALNWSGGKYPWHSPHVYAPLVVGCLVLIAFGVYEWKGRDDGLIPHVVFRHGPNFPLAAFSFAVEGWILYGAMIQLVAQETINLGFEHTAWRNAVRNLSYGITTLVFTIICSWWATHFKDFKTPLFFTYGAFLVASFGYANLSPDQNKVQIFYAFLTGLGQAGPLTLLVPIIQFATPHEYLSTASGLAYSARTISGAFGSAVLLAISNGYVHQHFAQSVGDAAVKAGLPPSSASKLVTAMQSKASAVAVKKVPGITPAIEKAATREGYWVYARSYRLAWWSIVPFVIIAIVCLYFIRSVKHLMDERVEATVEHHEVDKKDVETSVQEVRSENEKAA